MSDYQDPYCYPGTNVLKNVAGIKDQSALDAFEAEAVPVNLADMVANPSKGEFNTARLKETHQRTFEGVYDWAGEFREGTGFITKNRGAYRVTYGHSDAINGDLEKVFKQLASENNLKNLDKDTFAAKAAGYYAKLDEIHPFREGNSRTLRAFFTDLAREAGHHLDWSKSANSERGQKDLYFARDLAIINQDTSKLVELFKENVTAPEPQKAITQAFLHLAPNEAVKLHPELAPTYAALTALDKQNQADGIPEPQRREIEFRARENMAISIEQGKIPTVEIQSSKTAAADKSSDSSLER